MLKLILVATVTLLVASPALAATVWSWTTDDGTAAYTNDPKRIPAKYKDSATRRTIGPLKAYPRLTESDVRYEKPYLERVEARLDTLRGAPPAVSAGPPAAGEHPVVLDLQEIEVPVDTRSGEPIVTEDFSVRMRDSIATRNVSITRQGDEIIAVRVGRKNQRKLNERVDDAVADALGGRVVPAIGPN